MICIVVDCMTWFRVRLCIYIHYIYIHIHIVGRIAIAINWEALSSRIIDKL